MTSNPSPTNSQSDLRAKVERLIGTAILKNDKNYTDDMMALIESTATRREQEARLEAELLQDQIDNYHKWFVEHRGDSLNEFLRSHAPSYIYGARLAQLLSSKTPPIQTKDKEK